MQEMERDRETRHRMLTIRDHIIGLEAQVASAQARQAKAERKLKTLTNKSRRKSASSTTDETDERPVRSSSRLFRRNG